MKWNQDKWSGKDENDCGGGDDDEDDDDGDDGIFLIRDGSTTEKAIEPSHLNIVLKIAKAF